MWLDESDINWIYKFEITQPNRSDLGPMFNKEYPRGHAILTTDTSRTHPQGLLLPIQRFRIPYAQPNQDRPFHWPQSSMPRLPMSPPCLPITSPRAHSCRSVDRQPQPSHAGISTPTLSNKCSPLVSKSLAKQNNACTELIFPMNQEKYPIKVLVWPFSLANTKTHLTIFCRNSKQVTGKTRRKILQRLVENGNQLGLCIRWPS